MPLLDRGVFVFYTTMDYSIFKKARKFGKDEGNKALLEKIGKCEDALEVFDWLKSNENKDADGKPIYSATVTVNIHGRRSEDGNENNLRTITYDTNLEFAEKKARENYERLLKEFEEKTNE